MRFRFRYLGPDGREFEVESLDGLRALVKSGAVGELTLLHDALTREWAPARAHAVYRLLREEQSPPAPSSTPTPPSMAEKPRRRRGSADDTRGDDDLGDLGLSITFDPPPDEPDAERTIRKFLREREQEGQPTERVDSFASPAAWSPAPRVPPTPPTQRAPASDDLPLIPPPPPDPISPRVVFASRVVDASWVPPVQPEERAPVLRLDLVQDWLDRAFGEIRRLVAHRSAPRLLIGAGLIGLLLLLLASVQHDRVAPAPEPSGNSVAAAAMVGPDLSDLVARSAVAKASGFQNMVAGMDSLRRVHDVEVVPAIWLEGAYLADAEHYPEVEQFWRRYQAFLHDVEASDTTLFRGGFVQQTAQEGADDAVLALSLSRAMRDFKNTQPERAQVYAEMEELAGAALALHALLVERADDIDYTPAIQHGVSREPVVEAVAQDTVLHDRMWSLLERIFASLEKLGGNLGGSRDNVTDMLMQGVEATSHSKG